MPPSQLKRLKTSLRDQGVVGPQKSKKQKKEAAKTGISKDKRIRRDVALQGIREQFNPFEVKIASRGSKFQFANAGTRSSDGVVRRPGVTKGLGEENRRKTLLVEMQRRKKVGGILDRRFGENDPAMTPEERAMERFVREKQSGTKRGFLFDLEEEVDTEEGDLTHLGQSLSFDKGQGTDDFDESGISLSNGRDADEEGEQRSRKRRRLSDSEAGKNGLTLGQDEDIPEKPKTKQEVMKEVIAKSKFHKYERQKAKEDDDDLRAELDQGLADIYSLLRDGKGQVKLPPRASRFTAEIPINPDRAALLNGKDRSQADKEYDERLRQMAFDARSKPTTRTKTEEEKLEEEAKKLKELEEKRLARMRGEDSDSGMDNNGEKTGLQGDQDAEEDDQNPTGLGAGIPVQSTRRELDVEDEDDFVIDDDLVGSGSDVDISDGDSGSSASEDTGSSDDERAFVQGLLSKEDLGRDDFVPSKASSQPRTVNSITPELAFTYACPQSHEELLQITKDISIQDLPTVVQRIRAIYHPKLNAENKPKLGAFSAILVDHISYLANQPVHPPFDVLEMLIRHVHSLAKSFPDEVGTAFRNKLRSLQVERFTSPTPGDLLLLTAISTIFPTSDHFHQVVTPAMLCMARYLSQKIPQTLSDLVKGTYITTLCIQYQRLSKHYIPEVVNYNINALRMLSPPDPPKPTGFSPLHESPASLRINPSLASTADKARRIQFWDIDHTDTQGFPASEALKLALLITHLALLSHISTLWARKSAFPEIFAPYPPLLTHLATHLPPSLQPPLLAPLLTTLPPTISHALTTRLPLALHRHRPLAIKTAIPKFEDAYHPAKHYDPDRERADRAKLLAEHKRERKGALRELRKDASFMAREGLRDKKERDEAYERKYKRLVAEIQGEEGREANAYERVKRVRRGGRGR
ncbi:nucleolar complex protein 14 [Xylographa carneopallida]|nr:nucleolar complex protein 14 [Xylographa carneopallida]